MSPARSWCNVLGRRSLDTRADLALCSPAPVFPAAAEQQRPRSSPPAAAAPPDDGQWTMPAKNYASTRYSELAEITADNVKNLQVAFTFSLGVNKGQEAAPLVVGNTMYIVTPYPNILYALDLAQPGAPHEMEVRAQARAGLAGRRLLRRRQPRRRLRRWPDLLQHTGRPHVRRRRRDRDSPSGTPRSATSISARPSRWRRSS